MQCNFSFRHWEEIIREAVRQRYNLTSFANYQGNFDRTIILRHDIDSTTRGVQEMATIEQRYGASSTFFIRVYANQYNPFGYNNYKIFKQVMALGHEIGLHFEAMSFMNEDELMTGFTKAKKVLETMFDTEIVSVSLHGYPAAPAPDYFNFHFRKLDIRNYAYDKKFTDDMKYISDSDGKWREKCLCQLLGKVNKLQVLTHPEWWWAEVEDVYRRW